jgi:plasmid rolling circle replication initiator protein Rep
MIKGKGIEIDDRSMTLDENDMAEYITVWNNGVPKWYKITHNNKGAYIVVEGKRHYVLVNEG